MAFKFLILAAVLAYARAGTSYIHQVPVAATYAAAPVAVHAPSIGASHQSVERSLGGAQSVSHYSKAVDSAFSSVRKYDTRITNDALRFAAAPLAVAHAAPLAVAHASPFSVAPGPVVTKAAIAYSPAAVVSHATFTGLGASYQW
ncbi:hypothetical protein NQ315_008687 [Exocentrus adspersus]|uniref:Pupal cuticle protein C1B n=1 Tax=Exocentrus adspersus TaxID=1586481 RepID=A0AAV8W845_9CUCU|nr:hypothetical protein NQ315_008687 [Exocentrus adspersus]